MNIAELIRKYRKQAGLTQKELAAALGIAPQNISVYETGQRIPKPDTLKRIAAALNVSFIEFFKAYQPELYIDPVDAAFIDQFANAGLNIDTLTNDMIIDFNALNREGQEKVLSYTIDLIASGKYNRE